MPSQLIKFGLFELNAATRQLHRQGHRVRLQEQPLRILEILLEQPGRLVTREELRTRLWPADVYVDFELGLNGAIKRLRLALDDSADNPIFIETVPKSGYRFLAPVEKISFEDKTTVLAATTSTPPLGDAQGAAKSSARPRPPAGAHPLRRTAARISVVVLLGLTFAAALYLLRPLTPPLQVIRVANLTRSGLARPQESLLSDGARLYYHVNDAAHGVQLRQILLNGNEDVPVEGLPSDLLVRDLSPDHTTFLTVSLEALRESHLSALYAVPVIGGAQRRLGSYLSNDPAWSPDGNSVAFVSGSRLFVGRADGSGERLLTTAPGDAYRPHFSPDGSRVRFTVVSAKGETSLWEVGADGAAAHALDFRWDGPSMEGYGHWSADGRYYVFASARDGISNLWVVENRADGLHRPRVEPVRLTAGPISFVRPLPSPDGSRIFALGTESAGELLRYDPTRHDFVQFLKGIGADQLNFSRDGAWIAFISFPDGALWRLRVDGSQRLQLTQPSLRALNPRWSPDGKRILFVARKTGQLPKLFTISAEGGYPEPVAADSHAQTSPTWSPSGDAIFFGRDPDGENQDLSLYRFNLKTGTTQRLEGSENLYAPMASPDGVSLVAQSVNSVHELILLDLRTGQRRVLSEHHADYPDWSADSRYVYFNTLMYKQPGLFRVRVTDSKIEKIADVPFLSTGSYGVWSGLAPDGSVLVLRSHVQTDVYALSLR